MELQWPLIIFTTLVAWSAGVFGTQSALALAKEGREIQLPALIASVALLAISGIAVFFHLQHWERIFNGFGHVTSGITQELVAVVVFVAVVVIYFALLRKSAEEGTVPKAIAVVGIVISVILALVCAHSYMMAARPAWDTIAWPLAMLCEAFTLGPLTVQAISAVKGSCSKLGGTLAVAGSVLSAVFSVVMVAVWQTSAGSFADVGYHFDPTSPNAPLVDVASEMNVLSGSLAPVVWAGIILVGAIAPFACAFLGKRQGDAGKTKSWLALGTIGTVCSLVGCVCLRVVFYELGFSVFMFY